MVEVGVRPLKPRNLHVTAHVPAVNALTVARVNIPPVLSSVITLEIEQIVGVEVETSKRCPSESRPEF